MSERKDIPAFPSIEYSEHNGHWEGRYEIYMQHHGMSLRDYFAAAALQGLCAAGRPVVINGVSFAFEKAAYVIADAMMKVREEK
jgi:hypothetical protein